MDTSNAENIAEMAAEPEAPTEVNFVWMFFFSIAKCQLN